MCLWFKKGFGNWHLSFNMLQMENLGNTNHFPHKTVE